MWSGHRLRLRGPIAGLAASALVLLSSCGGSPSSTATDSPSSTDERWTAAGVVEALEATTSGRPDLASFTTPTGTDCQAFPPLGSGEKSRSGYTLDDYESAPDPYGRSTGAVVRTMDRTAGARIQGADGYADDDCTAVARARLNAATPS